ncbi:MAG: glycosyltransferase [Prolixibacteraceae bacterium]|nr:glycosyltransferase [Prolixibacteraceae bacterium]
MSTNNKYKISIITPVLNTSATLEKCILSVANQTYQNIEHIFIDGLSTDGSVEIIKKYQKKYNHIILRSEKDKGIYDAMNKGIDRTTGNWLYFLGADDEFYNLNILSELHESGLFDQNQIFYGNVKIVGDTKWAKNGSVYNGRFDLKKLLKKNICQQAIFYPREIIQKIGYFSLEYPITSDWRYNLKCWKQNEFIYTNKIISNFYSGGKSSTVDEKIQYEEFAEFVFETFSVDPFISENINEYSPLKEIIKHYHFLKGLMLNPFLKEIKEGISVFTAVKNRSDFLDRALKTWTKNNLINEIIIVDWSSDDSLYEIIDKYQDGRILLATVKDQKSWVLSEAYNLAARLTTHNKILKLDADIEITEDFFDKNILKPGTFITGNWRTAKDENETHLNGDVFLFRNDFFKVNGYNEYITTYGWDDSDLYTRLSESGLERKYFSSKTLYHIPHESRMQFQKQPKIFENLTEIEWERLQILSNRHLALHAVKWDSKKKMQSFNIEFTKEEKVLLLSKQNDSLKVPDKVKEESTIAAIKARLVEIGVLIKDEIEKGISKGEAFELYKIFLSNEFKTTIPFIKRLKSIQSNNYNKIDELNIKVEDIEQSNIIKDLLINEQKKQIEKITKTIQTKDSTIKNQQKTINDFCLKAENLASEIVEKSKDINQQKSEIKDLTQKVEELSENNSKQSGIIEKLKSEIDKLTSDIEKHNHDKESLTREVNSIKKHSDELKKEIKAYKESISYKLLNPIHKLLKKVKVISILYFFSNKYYSWKNLSTIKYSRFFNRKYYLRDNPDVAKSRMNPAFHYLLHGGFEGRNPSVKFESEYYLRNNPDVQKAKINPLLHYLLHGKKEGRKIKPISDANNSKTGEAKSMELKSSPKKTNRQLIAGSDLFDKQYYLDNYPDVAKSGMDPANHYLIHGGFEGRNPSSKFDTKFYLKNYPDVIKAKMNPLLHYLKFGQKEGRGIKQIQASNVCNKNHFHENSIKKIQKSGLFDKNYYYKVYKDVYNAHVDALTHYYYNGWKENRNPSENFDTKFYLKKYPDVSSSGMNPLYHYIEYGIKEGRLPKPDNTKKSIWQLTNIFDPLFYKYQHHFVPNDDSLIDHFGKEGILKGAFQNKRIAEKKLNNITYSPFITIIIPVYNSPSKYLSQTIDSILNQIYQKWELIIIDDGSTSIDTIKFLKNIAKKDNRVHVKYLKKNSGISKATNTAIKYAKGSFIAFIDHDDLITPNCLLEVVFSINNNQEADIFYTDQVYINEKNEITKHFYKPDWSPWMFRGVMYICHLLVVKTKLAQSVEGFSSEFDFVQDFEFMLRISEKSQKIIHINKALYYWRQCSESVAGGGKKSINFESLQEKAVNNHFKRLCLPIKAHKNNNHPHRLILDSKFKYNSKKVLAIIILNNISSARYSKEIIRKFNNYTSYKNIEWVALSILSNNNVNEFNNIISKSSFDFLLLTNEAMIPCNKKWISKLLSFNVINNIGATGPVIIKNKKVVSAGLTCSRTGISNSMSHFNIDSDGYAGNLNCIREVSAISPHCVLIDKEIIPENIILYPELGIYLNIIDILYNATLNGQSNLLIPQIFIKIKDIPGFNINLNRLEVDLWKNLRFASLSESDIYYNINFNDSEIDYTIKK